MIARHVLPPGGRTDQENLLKLVASQVATLVENSRLYEGVTRRAAEHESLVEAGRLLASTLEVGEVLQRLTELVQRRLQVDVVRIWLQDRSPEAGGTDVNPVEDIVGWIINHRAPLVLPDLASDARVRDRSWVSAEGLVSFLGVPFLLEGEPVGVMLALSRQPRAFTAAEVGLAEALATSAAAAIRNARLYEETQHRLRQTELLVEVGRAVGSTLDPGEVARRATEEMVKALGADFGAAWRVTDGTRLTYLGGHRVPDELLTTCAAAAASLKDRLLREALDLGAPLYATDSQADPRFAHPLLRSVAHKSLLVFPMLLKGRVVGGFAVAWVWDHHRLVPDDLRLAEGIAHQAAMAIENSQLYGELREALHTLEDSQKQIVRTERLRALGEMAGGVAHDFNNLLAIIVGRAELLLVRTKEEEVQKQLNLIVKVGVDAARTVKRIQEFTRMRKARPFQPVNLTMLAEETVEMTRSRWKNEAEAKGVRYEIAVETTPVPAVAGDPSEIREALTNIVFNALDVMPEGGRVTLRTGVEADRVFCSVSDTGSGMTDEVKQRVFDPFFTTKGERGTGLGLSVVYGIVNRHGGDIEVQSRVGHGSVFTVRLPVSRDTAEAPVSRPAVVCQRRGKILVIDDEPYVCGVLQDLLAGDGHQVITCEDGESGLTRFEAEPFDMVITDFGMPRMSGWDVARFVKLQQPQMPVAMVTGWSDRFDPAEIATRGVDYVVAKPFKLEDIRAVVASALNRTLV
jgi:signal transduction histidine kinase